MAKSFGGSTWSILSGPAPLAVLVRHGLRVLSPGSKVNAEMTSFL
jgi:hypothetical protein